MTKPVETRKSIDHEIRLAFPTNSVPSFTVIEVFCVGIHCRNGLCLLRVGGTFLQCDKRLSVLFESWLQFLSFPFLSRKDLRHLKNWVS